MSGRPGEWNLLGVDSDPLPGDPAAVSGAVRDYTSTAEAIRDQVNRLRTMAQGTNELVGEYAPKLRETAGDLADNLAKAEGRFDTVAQQLGTWEPVLDNGITETGSLLRQAVDAQASIDANKAPSTPVDPQDDAAVSADHARDTRLTSAQGDLARIQRQFDTLMGSVNHTASVVAKAIDDASHDQLEDSWWDRHVRKWIHDNAGWLKAVADVLTWVATALVIAVVLLSNPAGWMILAAMALTAGALLIHTALAAQGDGSWVDVALDAFALVTMGSGKLLSEGARGAYATRMGVEGFGDATSAARSAFSEASGFGSKAMVWLTRSNPIARTVSGLGEGLSRFSTAMGELEGSATWLSRISFGEKQGAVLYDAITSATERLGTGLLLNTSRVLMNGARASFIAGSLVDVTGKVLNPAFDLGEGHDVLPWGDGHTIKPGVAPWVHWVEENTVSTSFGW